MSESHGKESRSETVLLERLEPKWRGVPKWVVSLTKGRRVSESVRYTFPPGRPAKIGPKRKRKYPICRPNPPYGEALGAQKCLIL